jgi:hypothetical protein
MQRNTKRLREKDRRIPELSRNRVLEPHTGHGEESIEKHALPVLRRIV